MKNTSRLVAFVLAFLRDVQWSLQNASSISDSLQLIADFAYHRITRNRRGEPSRQAPLRTVKLANGTSLVYRQDRCDIWTIHEVWVDRCYKLAVPMEIRTILDIGANIGLTSVWLSRQFPHAEIIGVEPVLANAEVAKENFKANGIKGEVFRAAVSDHEGTASFSVGAGATNGRLIDAPVQGGGPARPTTIVPLITMNQILCRWAEDVKIDLVKIDIEGGEDALITDEAPWLARIRILVIEFHPQLANYPRMLKVLASKGFRRVSKEVLDRNTLEIFHSFEIETTQWRADGKAMTTN